MSTKNKLIDLQVTIEELYHGTTKTIAFQKCLPCAYCCLVKSSECARCCGHGVNLDLSSLKETSLILCPDCEGCGVIKETICKNCDDLGVVFSRREISVKVPRGTYPEELITFPGEACQQPGMAPGDVIVRIVVSPHPYFEAVANSPNLFYKNYQEYTKTDEVTTLDGQIIKVKGDDLGPHGLWSKDGIFRGNLRLL